MILCLSTGVLSDFSPLFYLNPLWGTIIKYIIHQHSLSFPPHPCPSLLSLLLSILPFLLLLPILPSSFPSWIFFFLDVLLLSTYFVKFHTNGGSYKAYISSIGVFLFRALDLDLLHHALPFGHQFSGALDLIFLKICTCHSV